MKSLIQIMKFVAILGIVVVVVGLVFRPSPEEQLRNEQARAQKMEQKRIEDEENRRFTAELYAVRAVKRAMKNPDSFKLEAATRMSDGSLCIAYRATNSFNAVVPGMAVITKTRTVTSDSGSLFVAAWKKTCEGRSGENAISLRTGLKYLPD